MNRQNQYSAEFKKRASLLSEEQEYSSAARHLGPSESIDHSRLEEVPLSHYRIFPAAPTRKAFRGPKNGLAKFICERCSQFLPVNTELAQLKARELPREARVPRNNSCSGYKSSCIVRDSRFAEGRRSPRSFWPSTKKNWPSFSATSFGQPPFDCGFHLHYFALYFLFILFFFCRLKVPPRVTFEVLLFTCKYRRYCTFGPHGDAGCSEWVLSLPYLATHCTASLDAYHHLYEFLSYDTCPVSHCPLLE